jgi:beta-phosphoglucomutase-like phosphatase (HAD superfamily)
VRPVKTCPAPLYTTIPCSGPILRPILFKLARYFDREGAAAEFAAVIERVGAHEVAVVRNLDYVYSPVELYPLAPRITQPLERVAAFAVDMDGTSTTTEPLALHSLEYMVRRYTGRMSPDAWPGLDEEKDLPHVIGNSNFRHTEFLLSRYPHDEAALRHGFIEALAWTLANMNDAQRLRDVHLNAANCGLAGLLKDLAFVDATSKPIAYDLCTAVVAPFVARHGAAFRTTTPSALVSAALDVYYARYHYILDQMEQGRGDELAREFAHGAPHGGAHLVAPMPGYAIFVALIKGWLGEDADLLFDTLRDLLLHDERAGVASKDVEAFRPRLAKLGRHFEQHPAKIALVTASIAYETHAVMHEVIRIAREEARSWPLPAARKAVLDERFANYRAVFDGFVCASDAHEARLKPHRDLYAIALYQMAVPKDEYPHCVGLEDTEPGIISLRAAGIGCAVALPNRDTHRQDYAMASRVVHGGLPEVILVLNAFLDEKAFR